MKYRLDPISGNQLSILGFGCLRFPSSYEKTEKLILKAIESGINYFDTAYIYSDSEERLGEVLNSHGLREKVYLATKLPCSMVKKPEDFDRYFDIQLARLKTDYIDYYLMHMLADKEKWESFCRMGIIEWIKKQKESGRIRQIGFSFHGSRQDFLDVLDAYDWEFCLIQYNYVDENNQAGVTGLKAAAQKGLPVMIMEPLLGGRLVTNLPKKVSKAFATAQPNQSAAAWALNWLWNQSEVTVVLSGMNEDFQLEDNLITADQAMPNMITSEQMRVYGEIKEIFASSYKVACTGCNYCMPCPFGVNIPACFSAYNLSYAMGRYLGIKQYIMSTAIGTKLATASQCRQCGKCERACPQKIEIRKNLKRVQKRVEPFWCKAAIPIVRRVLKIKRK